MRQLTGIVSLAIFVGAWGGCSRSASPTSPDAPSAPQPTYTLSGLVFAATSAGPVPIEGVLVSEANSRRSATTSKDGLYSLSGLLAASNSISVSGSGIAASTKTITQRVPRVPLFVMICPRVLRTTE